MKGIEDEYFKSVKKILDDDVMPIEDKTTFMNDNNARIAMLPKDQQEELSEMRSSLKS